MSDADDVLLTSNAARTGIERAKLAIAEADGSDLAPWVERIRPHLERSVESIVAAGRELTEAKAELEHGRFGALLGELGLSRRWAQKYMAAANVAIANPGSHLPASVSVLDVLGRLDAEELTEAIDSGKVTPSTTRAEAETVVATVRTTPAETVTVNAKITTAEPEVVVVNTAEPDVVTPTEVIDPENDKSKARDLDEVVSDSDADQRLRKRIDRIERAAFERAWPEPEQVTPEIRKEVARRVAKVMQGLEQYMLDLDPTFYDSP
jgi:hypothetical protein